MDKLAMKCYVVIGMLSGGTFEIGGVFTSHKDAVAWIKAEWKSDRHERYIRETVLDPTGYSNRKFRIEKED